MVSVAVRSLRRALALATGVVAFLALFLALMVLPAARASAAELSGVFTSVSIVQSTAGQFERMDVKAAFTLPPGAAGGDTFTLSVGDPFSWVQDSFTIKDPDTGEVVATVVVNGSTATFTLTDYVNTRQDITGTTDMFVAFKQGSVTGGETVTATFTTKDETFTDTVTVTGPTPPPPFEKVFVWDDPATQESFAFAITGRTPAAPPATGTVTITDRPGSGVQVTCDSLRFQSAPNVGGVPGAWTAIPLARVVLQCPAPGNARGFVATFPDVPADTYVRVRGKATVTDPSRTRYVNEADVTVFGQTPVVVTDGVRRVGGSGQAQGDVPAPPTTAPPTTPPTTAPPTRATPTGGRLAQTGLSEQSELLGGLAVVFIGLGTALVAASRRLPVSRPRGRKGRFENR